VAQDNTSASASEDIPRFRRRRQEVSDHLVDLPVGTSDPVVSVEQLHEPGIVVRTGVARQEGVRLEHRFEPLSGTDSLVPPS
jgi:hypothetical protein